MLFFKKTFKYTFLFIFLAELFSFFGYLLPAFNKAAFLIIALVALILSLYKMEYGVWILLAELFIGSKGYLFYFDQGGFTISVRMALWLIVMSVWLAKVSVGWLKTKKTEIQFLKSPYFPYFFILFIFIGWGVINGVLKHNDLSNIFFDFNNWLYFALIFPLFDVISGREKFEKILQILVASIGWLSLKTFFLLFIFSHNLIGMVYELYRWVRTSGVGEITQMPSGFVRIFFQSHIFVLIGLFLFIILISAQIIEKQKNKKFPARPPTRPPFTLPNGDVGRVVCVQGAGRRASFFLLLTFLLSVVLITFSRSFWAGLLAAFLFFCLFILLKLKIGWNNFLKINGVLLVSAILSFTVIFAIVKFPYPKPTADFGASIFSERAGAISGEAGAASRWSLLPELWQKIKISPFFGDGFGATVTYKTRDPRVLESNAGGEYTTYAFEWGWLDIWLKLGFFGLLAYAVLIIKIILNLISGAFSDEITNIKKSFAFGLIVISIVSIFSPYLNHPLGIGYVILAALAARLHE